MHPESIEYLSVCILGADRRESILKTIESVSRFNLTIHVGVDQPRELLHGLPGVHQHQIIWTDDFAFARNQLLNFVTSQFVLWIDSDEYLFSFPRLNWGAMCDPIYAVQMVVKSGMLPSASIRLHRHQKNIAWKGLVHEQLTLDGNELLRSSPKLAPGIALVHNGYEDKSTLTKKNVRNRRIAQRKEDLSQLSRGELLALARSETFRGNFNALLWVYLYRFSQDEGIIDRYDLRHEPALMLLAARYSAPALQVLSSNPLIVPIQLGMLAYELLEHKQISQERFQFLCDTLRLGLYDSLYTFPLELVGGDPQLVMHHIQNLALDWTPKKIIDKPMNMPLIDQNSQYQQLAGVQSETFEDELIMMHPKSWRAVALNSVAAVLWEALAWPQSLAQLLDLYLEAFPQPDQKGAELLINDVLQLLLTHEFIVKK